MKLDVYGCNISYYTGKLEAYLRYRSIPYQSLPTVGNEKKLLAGAGVVQMPVVQNDDGRWMTDTTPMLAWLDGHYENGTIYPADPMLRFAALLIEDYADEWLWRPAMHYRWSYRVGRVSAAEAIYTDIVEGNRAIPRWLAIRMIKARQLGGFVKGDGVSRHTWAHTEQTYFTALDRLRRAQPEAAVGRRLDLHRHQPVAARAFHPLAQRRHVRQPRVVLAGGDIEDRDRELGACRCVPSPSPPPAPPATPTCEEPEKPCKINIFDDEPSEIAQNSEEACKSPDVREKCPVTCGVCVLPAPPPAPPSRAASPTTRSSRRSA